MDTEAALAEDLAEVIEEALEEVIMIGQPIRVDLTLALVPLSVTIAMSSAIQSVTIARSWPAIEGYHLHTLQPALIIMSMLRFPLMELLTPLLRLLRQVTLVNALCHRHPNGSLIRVPQII